MGSYTISINLEACQILTLVQGGWPEAFYVFSQDSGAQPFRGQP